MSWDLRYPSIKDGRMIDPGTRMLELEAQIRKLKNDNRALRTALWLMVLVIIAAWIVGCSDATGVIDPPPIDDDDSVIVYGPGPPSYAVSTPSELLLYVGEEQALPTVVVFNEDSKPIAGLAIGWRYIADPPGLRINLGSWTVLADEPLEASLWPMTQWEGAFWLFGSAKVTIRAINK